MRFPCRVTIARRQLLLFPLGIFGLFSCTTDAFAAHPRITDDAGTMGAGKAQLEMNGEYGHEKEDGVITKTTQGDAAFSYGLSDSVDLVIDLPYLHSREKSEEATVSENGFSDTSIEVKWGGFMNMRT